MKTIVSNFEVEGVLLNRWKFVEIYTKAESICVDVGRDIGGLIYHTKCKFLHFLMVIKSLMLCIIFWTIGFVMSSFLHFCLRALLLVTLIRVIADCHSSSPWLSTPANLHNLLLIQKWLQECCGTSVMVLIFSEINPPTFIEPSWSITIRDKKLLTMNSEVLDNASRVCTINDSHALGIERMCVVWSLCLASCLP